jgi:pimeloyl-ACP methyl ester carboxylesterase
MPRLFSFVHALADDLITQVISRPRLYPDGFGDLDGLEALVDRVRAYSGPAPADAIDIRWTHDPVVYARSGIVSRRGVFESPRADILAERSHRAGVELIMPGTDHEARGPVCLLLAATGEEGFTLRRRFAVGLASLGIGSLLLENPFYGDRRPPGQWMSILRTVRDQFAMNVATVDEGRSLLRWLHTRGHERIGVTGYSQGGMMTAFCAALTPFAVAAIPRAAGCSAVPIFTEMALGRRFAWDRLAASFESLDAARSHFRRCLKPVDVRRFPPPVDTRLAVIVASRHDRFIPVAEATALAEHWAGARMQWVEAGHLTGALLFGRAQLDAVRTAFAAFDPR